MYVEVHPTGGVAVVSDPEGDPERAAQRNRSVEGAVVANLPGEKHEHESGGRQDGGGKPLRSSRGMWCSRFLRRFGSSPEGIDGPGGENGAKRECRCIGQRAEATEDAKSEPTRS